MESSGFTEAMFFFSMSWLLIIRIWCGIAGCGVLIEYFVNGKKPLYRGVIAVVNLSCAFLIQWYDIIYEAPIIIASLSIQFLDYLNIITYV